jgi:hypothetical protein
MLLVGFRRSAGPPHCIVEPPQLAACARVDVAHSSHYRVRLIVEIQAIRYELLEVDLGRPVETPLTTIATAATFTTVASIAAAFATRTTATARTFATSAALVATLPAAIRSTITATITARLLRGLLLICLLLLVFRHSL